MSKETARPCADCPVDLEIAEQLAERYGLTTLIAVAADGTGIHYWRHTRGDWLARASISSLDLWHALVKAAA